MKRILVCMLLMGALQITQAPAQTDPHFSQYYAYPMWLNPALTGAIDGDYRISANYRTQWSQLAKAFSTVGVSADLATSKSYNIGINLLNQTAGDGGYRYTSGYVTFAYTGVRFGAEGYKRLVLSLQAGMLDRRFDPGKLSFGDQWNPVTGYDPSVSGDVMNRYASTAFDAGAGALYFDGEPDKRVNIFGGVSVYHLTRPDDKFYTNSPEKIPMRVNIHGGARIGLGESLFLTPNFLYSAQGNQTEKMLGAHIQLTADVNTNVLLGGYYRFNDAVVPFAGLNYRNMVLGISYDVNASDLKNVSRSPNAFELSLSFIGRKNRPYPVEYFICPRL